MSKTAIITGSARGMGLKQQSFLIKTDIMLYFVQDTVMMMLRILLKTIRIPLCLSLPI